MTRPSSQSLVREYHERRLCNSAEPTPFAKYCISYFIIREIEEKSNRFLNCWKFLKRFGFFSSSVHRRYLHTRLVETSSVPVFVFSQIILVTTTTRLSVPFVFILLPSHPCQEEELLLRPGFNYSKLMDVLCSIARVSPEIQTQPSYVHTHCWPNRNHQYSKGQPLLSLCLGVRL